MTNKQMMALGAYALVGLGLLLVLLGQIVLPVLMLGTAFGLWLKSGERQARVDQKALQEIEDFANRREGRDDE